MYIIRRLSRLLLVLTLVAFAVFSIYHRAGVDSRGPQISVGEPLIEVSVNDGEEALLQGVTAKDSADGDVTASLSVENISTFYSDRKRLVTYVAFDSDNHVARVTREMRYTDYEPPKFVLSEPLIYLPGAVNLKIEAEDCLDGNITSAIKLAQSDLVTTDQPGMYNVIFQVANSAGDVSSLSAEVEILEGTVSGAPVFTLNRYIDYIPTGGSFDVFSYIDTVKINGREYSVVAGQGNFNSEDIGEDEEIVVGSDMITVSGGVDTNTPGTYKVTYSMTLDRGHSELVSGHTTLYVVVR